MKGPGDRGYIMVVLLIGMGITAIWMSAALPAWRHQVQRQREEDLIFIGEQYARAIVLYQKKNRGAYPPSIEILVSQRHLRRAWKDPITGEDFAPIGIGIQPQGQPQGQPTGGTPGRNTGPAAPQQPGRGGTPQQGQMVGISGVRSRSQETSIKIYKNLQQHSLWPFDAAQMYGVMGSPFQQQGGQGGPTGPGGPGRGGPTGPGRGGPAGPGGPGTGRGGPTGPVGPTLPGRGRGGF